MTMHQIAALGGLAGALIALLWIAFDDAKPTNEAINHGASDVSNSDHGSAI